MNAGAMLVCAARWLAKAKAAREGAVHAWRDGKLHRKQGGRWVVVPHGGHTVETQDSPPGHGWHDHAERDGDVVAALSKAHGVEAVERVLRGVRHREFAVALDAMGKILAVTGGPMTSRAMLDHDNVIAVNATHRTAMPMANAATVIVTHNHPGGTPIGGSDIVEAMRVGAREIRATTWHGTYVVELKGAIWNAPEDEARDLGTALHARVKAAFNRAMRAHSRGFEIGSLIWNPSEHTMSTLPEVVHEIGARIAASLNADPKWREDLIRAGHRARVRYERVLEKALERRGGRARERVLGPGPARDRDRLRDVGGDSRPSDRESQAQGGRLSPRPTRRLRSRRRP